MLLNELGASFRAGEIPVNWDATAKLPSSVTIFKVLPTHFTYGCVSNLVCLAQLADPTKALSLLKPAIDGRDAYYYESERKLYLGLSPSRGRAYYRNDGAIPLPRQSNGTVADYGDVVQTALRMLAQLSIDQSQLATKAGTKDLFIVRDSREQTSFDKVLGKPVKRTIARGVSLFRSTNGISFTGRGRCDGFYLSMAGGQQIAEMELVWRNLQPDRSVPVVEVREIIDRVKAGKAVIVQEDRIDTIKSLRVRSFDIYYLGRDGLDVETMVYPFIALNALAQIGDSSVDVIIDCPLLQ